jgi:heat shock protein HslJ
VALAVVSLAVAGCMASDPQTPKSTPTAVTALTASPGPSASPPAASVPPSSPSAVPTALPDPAASDPVAFDLSGSAWQATSVLGRAMPAENPPRLEFDWLGRPEGTGFTGCDEFGFEATFHDGRVIVGGLATDPSGCDGPGSDVEEAFLMAFGGAEVWSVQGDRLSLDGSGGQIVLTRDLPPMGDPGRQLAETLRVGQWRILRAPGVVGLERLPSVRFADTLFVAVEDGDCGFSGKIRFRSSGALTITEMGWDAIGCGDPSDGRPALQRLLEAVTSGGPGPAGTIVLSGSQGEVVLGR